MSGLYLLVVVGIWVGLTSLFIKGWRRWRVRAEARRRTVDVLCLAVALLWAGASFWYGGGRKIYYDTLVNRMCKQDGGVKVYETVKLPAEKFDKWGMVKPYDPTQGENTLGFEYVFKINVRHFNRGNPEMWSTHIQILHRGSNKLLGESIRYSRRGGDLPGPWHESSFACPQDAGQELLIRSIFLVTNTGSDK